MSTEYIWYKNGKEVKRTADPEGKIITRKITSPTTYIEYDYFYDGNVYYSLECEIYYKNNTFHRGGDKPAVISYYIDGSLEAEEYYKDGKRHREGDKPAYIDYYKDGSVMAEYYFKDGVEYKPTTRS